MLSLDGGKRGLPVELLKAEATGIVVVYFMDSSF